MRVLHYIPERLLSSEEEGGFHGSTDLTREYLSVLTTGMGKGIEAQVTTTVSQFKQKVKEIQPDIVHIHDRAYPRLLEHLCLSGSALDHETACRFGSISAQWYAAVAHPPSFLGP